MKKILLLSVIFFWGLTTFAQEIFDMPNATGTYLNGINDSGEICGYYNTASATLAFEIDKYGDTINLTGPGGSNAYVTATGISNSGMVVGNYGANSVTAQVYIYLPNPGRNAGGTYYAVPTWGGTNTAAAGITNDTCIAGSYEVGPDNDGALWCKSSGTVNSLRCNNQGSVIPTVGCDIDINHNVCGYIIEGAQEQCFIYRTNTLTWDTFMVGGIKSRALGMNDNGWVCGNYNSETQGFYAKKLAGQNLSNLIQIKVLGATTIYPSHINNDTDIVGFYTDAAGKAHGFILAKYDIGFRPSINGYSWANDAAGCWPAFHYTPFNYATDPYLNNGSPFPLNTTAQPPQVIQSVVNDAWPDCVRGHDITGLYSTIAGKLVLKPAAYQAWLAAGLKYTFQGACFGNSYTCCLIWENFAAYAALFPNCAGYSNLTAHNFPHNDSVITAINVMQSKEDYSTVLKQWNDTHEQDLLKTTLQSVKQELRNSRGRVHSGVGMILQHATGAHSVFPYKLIPGVGGNGVDSIFVYDSNYPGLDNLCITTDLKVGANGDWHYTANGHEADYGGNSGGLGFGMDPPSTVVTQTMQFSAAPRGQANVARGNGFITAFYNSSSLVQMTDDNDSVARISVDSSEGTALIIPVNRDGGISGFEPVQAYTTSNVTTVNKITNTDTVANYMGILDDNYLIRCDRTSGTDTSDNYLISAGSLTYVNNTDSAKALTYQVFITDSNYEYDYAIGGLTVAANNKVTVTNYGATGMVLQNFGPATTYTITTYFLTDSIRTFTDVIPIQSNTEHIIQPHDTTASGIYILVDTGMTGNIEDSIFIHQTVTDINRVNAPDITAWPVPTDNLLYMSGPQGLVHYKIVDVTGRVVSTGELDFGNGTTQNINVGYFAPGVYTITGVGPQGKWTYMFVKQ